MNERDIKKAGIDLSIKFYDLCNEEKYDAQELFMACCITLAAIKSSSEKDFKKEGFDFNESVCDVIDDTFDYYKDAIDEDC